MLSTRGKRVTYNDEIPLENDRDFEYQTEIQLPTKRRKDDGDSNYSSKSKGKVKINNEASASTSTPSTRKHGRKRRGRLANLMNMPVDIFSEISSHLHPLDLLHLAWTSKVLRSTLMSKTWKGFWRSARENQVPDMPECPDELTEPQYAALVFTTVCQACACTRALCVRYELYSRHCNRCADDQVVRIPGLKGSESALECLVGLECLVSIIPTAPITRRTLYTYRWISKQTMEATVESWLTLEAQCERDAFTDSRKAIVQNIQIHTDALMKWQAERDQEKILKLRDIRNSRLESIRERILAVGWATADIPNTGPWFKLVDKHQPLTDKAWNKLYPKLVPHLEYLKAQRLEMEREERRRSRAQQLALYCNDLRRQRSKEMTGTFFPGGGRCLENALYEVSPFKELIDDDDHILITTERWEEKVPEVIEFFKTCTAELERVVTSWYIVSLNDFLKRQASLSQKSILHTSLREPREGQGSSSWTESLEREASGTRTNIDLRRPTVVFRCIECHEPLWYPACFHHEHFYGNANWTTISSWRASAYNELYRSWTGPMGLSFDPSLSSTTSRLLVHLGLQSDTIFSEQLSSPLPNPLSMDYNHNAKYVCLLCDETARKPMTMVKQIEHLRTEYDIFQIRQDAIISKGRSAFANLGKTEEIPFLQNDHDFSGMPAAMTLWRHVSENDILLNEKCRDEYFQRIEKYLTPDYHPIIVKYSPQRGRFYYCELCPMFSGFSSLAYADMVIHIKAKHRVDVESELEFRSVKLEQARDNVKEVAKALANADLTMSRVEVVTSDTALDD